MSDEMRKEFIEIRRKWEYISVFGAFLVFTGTCIGLFYLGMISSALREAYSGVFVLMISLMLATAIYNEMIKAMEETLKAIKFEKRGKKHN